MTDGGERLIVVGGRQRKKALDLDEWQAYEKGIILVVDTQNGNAEVVEEYSSPKEVCADESPSIVFKAGELAEDGKHLVLCTQTEVMEYRIADWKPTFYFSHPTFNDLHHVCYRSSDLDGKKLLVANTGLDQVVELSCDLERNEQSAICRQWSVCEEETWTRFDHNIDYRKVATTKPHLAHPNFVFEYENEIYVTRFHQQDAIELVSREKSLNISAGNPHDGVVRDAFTLFTTTNGHLVKFNLSTGECSKTVDLNQYSQGDELLGWCRGVLPMNDEQVWVGFSRIRPTWMRKNLSWIKQGFRNLGQYGTLPTRIAQYDLNSQTLIRELDLEKFGMNAVFGIYLLQQ